MIDTLQETTRTLPKGWRWARLGEVATYINGMAFKPDDWETSGTPIIRIQNLNNPDAPFNYYNHDVDERYRVKDGDLLISWSASLDAFMWQRGSAILNQHIFKVIEKQDVIRRDYLYFAVREAMGEIRAQVHGATMRHITRPEFEAIRIPLPSLPEQRRITTLLADQMTSVERARAAARARLAAARALPAALLRQVFEGVEARGWPRKRLGDIATLLRAKSIATNGDAEVQAITTACLTESGFNPAGVKTARMWSRDAKESIVSNGEILIARSNTPELVGRVALYEGEPPGIVASDLTIRIWPEMVVLPAFLTMYLSVLYLDGYWKERAGGASGSMKKITRSQLVEEMVPCPSVTDQEKVVIAVQNQMAATRQTCTALAIQLDAINALPAALLRRAFAGEL